MMNFIDLVINLVSGYSIFLLLTHLLNFLFQNLFISGLVSIFLTFYLILFSQETIKKYIAPQIKKLKLERFDYFAIVFSLLIAGLMASKDFMYGNPDNFHIALTASIAENNKYPPIFPSTFDMSMNSYHYGVDLIGAIFMKFFNLSSWDAQTTQIFFDVSLTLLSLYALILYFSKKSSTSFWSLVIVTFYTSINSLDFIVREVGNFLDTDKVLFLRTWLIASWTSVSHLSSQLRLPSQNSAFFFCFLLIILLAQIKQENKKYFASVAAAAFGVYFTFPAFYYPMLAALGLFLLWDLIQRFSTKNHQSQWLLILISIGAIILGKILTFTGSHTDGDGINALKIAFSPYWVNWGKSYLNYFYDSYYLQNLQYAIDYAHPAYHPKIPFFSSITFREFGFEALLCFFISLYQIKNKKTNFSIYIFICGLIAMSVPFCIEFSPRPIETMRFLHLSKIFFLIFAVINLPGLIGLGLKELEELSKSKIISRSIQILLIILVATSLVPGIASVTPKDEFVITGPNAVPIKFRPLLKAMQKIHKTGDVCLDKEAFKHGHNISELSGFYGPGGQMYKSDDISRNSAMLSLNPMILKDLHINYILMTPRDQITMEAAYRLAQRDVYQKALEMNINNEFYTLYKFSLEKANIDSLAEANLREEYRWILACEIGGKYEIIRNPDGKIISSQSKDEIIKMKSETKKRIAQSNLPCAFWLKEQIVLNSMLAAK